MISLLKSLLEAPALTWITTGSIVWHSYLKELVNVCSLLTSWKFVLAFKKGNNVVAEVWKFLIFLDNILDGK